MPQRIDSKGLRLWLKGGRLTRSQVAKLLRSDRMLALVVPAGLVKREERFWRRSSAGAIGSICGECHGIGCEWWDT